MTLWPSAYSTHLGVGRPRFHFLLQEQLLYFYIKELLVLDTLRLSWWGYWTQISHIPGEYQWAKQQSVIEVITAISDRLKKKKKIKGAWLWRSRLRHWLLWGSPSPKPVAATSGPEIRRHSQLSSTELYTLPLSLPQTGWLQPRFLVENAAPELYLGDCLERYQLTWLNSCQGKLKGKHCRWSHASA